MNTTIRTTVQSAPNDTCTTVVGSASSLIHFADHQSGKVSEIVEVSEVVSVTAKADSDEHVGIEFETADGVRVLLRLRVAKWITKDELLAQLGAAVGVTERGITLS